MPVSQVEVARICACHLRMECLDLLASGPVCVSLISKKLGWTQPEVSRALVALRDAGCVEYTQHKRERMYRLSALVVVVRDGDRLIFDISSRDGGILRVIRPPRPSVVLALTRDGIQQAV